MTEHIDMGLHPKIKELKIGGPFSEEEALHGGLTFSTKCVALNYFISVMNSYPLFKHDKV